MHFLHAQGEHETSIERILMNIRSNLLLYSTLKRAPLEASRNVTAILPRPILYSSMLRLPKFALNCGTTCPSSIESLPK